MLSPYQITKLENQSNRDSATIAQLNMELRKFTANLNDSKGEIARLQKTVSLWWALIGITARHW